MTSVNQVGCSGERGTNRSLLGGRYRLAELLARGGQAELRLAEDTLLGDRCVLKILAPRLPPARLRSEFARLSELAHPNIVRVRDAGVGDTGPLAGRAYVALDYLAGASLADSLPDHPLAARVERFTRAAEALADALAYLHGKGVVHGDLGPANVRCDGDGRPFLIDFGLAELLGASPVGNGASGTLGFLAPEALLGERGTAGDLFALGATLYDAWTGVAPFGLGMDAVRRAWEGPPPPPSTLLPGLPADWDVLLQRLLAPAIEDRPSSARAVLRDIRRTLPGPVAVEDDLAPPFPAGDPFAGLLVGRGGEVTRLRRQLEELAQGTSSASVVCVAGAASSGRHALIRHMVRDARLATLAGTLPGIDVEDGECSRLLERLARDEGALAPAAEADLDGRLALLVASLEARASARPLCLALAGSPEDERLARAVASNPPSGRLLILFPCLRPPSSLGPGLAVLELGGLSRAAVLELARRGLGVEPPSEVLERIVTVSGGLPGLMVPLIRAWLDPVRPGGGAGRFLETEQTDLASLLDASFASLSQAGRVSVLRSALAPALSTPAGDDPGASSATDLRARFEARAAGWEGGGPGELASEAHWEAFWRAVSAEPALALAARAAVPGLPAADPRRGELELALGNRSEAAASFWLAMQAAEARQVWSQVAHLGLRALAADGGSGTWPRRLALASALGNLGRYDEAVRVLDGGTPPGEPSLAAKLAERRAWVLGRRGEPEAAQRLLASALRELPAESEEALLLRARLARLLVASGRYADALATAEPALASGAAAGLAAREAAVLAAAYAGRLPAAERMLASLREAGRGDDERGFGARLAALEGLLAQLAGRPGAAATSYRQAVRDYEQMRDVHGAAAAAFNLGCALAETGDFSGAMAALERSIRELGRLGVASDHGLALFNVGQLFLQLGDLPAAARARARLEHAAKASEGEVLGGYAHWLAAELERRRGEGACLEHYAAASAVFERLRMDATARLVELGEVEATAELGKVAEARARLVAVSAQLEPSMAAAGGALAEGLALAAGRVALADSAAPRAELTSAGARIANAARRARELGRAPSAWRGASLAARLFERAGDARSAEELALARQCFEEVKMRTPIDYRQRLESDGEAPLLGGAAAGAVSAARAERAGLLESRLRRLLRINKRLNSDLRLSRVLETIIDTVIELTDAERGFLLLKDAGGELVVKVARNIDQTTLDGAALSLSRSIARQAAESGEPVITVDAADDRRFAEHLSVSDLRLRSVLAVPLAVKGTVVGTLYVDHRLRKGVFGDDEVAMVLDFAEQGAIAIENARVISELRRREQQIQSLNRRLERELRAQEAALSEARVELKESRQAAGLRYDYRNIVGQSPAMLELFHLLDRVTDTNLPVVIEGESGTGKELVARALHVHGPRKEQAFVSENCAAIPETLLESALFGHARGAFTGADRDARGLFAIAHGGTLFLDEVADMSPAMQSKLLRVLQNGEFHRVGSERIEKADVRVMVASNQNLGRLVEEGKFRKDLYYRLSVVRLYLPPLRERREDIPLLVRHFLDKEKTAVPRQVDAAALARLSAYAWPGNVRELENEITRAGAFAGPTIGVADLSPHIQSGQDPSEVVRNEPDSLRLRQRVERLERQLIREALTRSQGNQTKAALLLGLSRFGLQKKLRRYGLGV